MMNIKNVKSIDYLVLLRSIIANDCLSLEKKEELIGNINDEIESKKGDMNALIELIKLENKIKHYIADSIDKVYYDDKHYLTSDDYRALMNIANKFNIKDMEE